MMQNMTTQEHKDTATVNVDAPEARRAKGASPNSSTPPNPEVSIKSTRRAFTAKYKRDIVERADACQNPGEIGALLRREGLYSSHLCTWRRLYRQGALDSLTAQPRGPKPDPTASEKKIISQLERRIARLENDLKKAHTIIDVQKKLSVLLSNMPEQESS